jgi:hypothetical protein
MSGIWREVMNNVRYESAARKAKDQDKEPRLITDEDISSWQAASSLRIPTKKMTPEVMWRMLSDKNPVRARRLRKDFQWAQKQASKLGLNPQDVRFIL